jgi:hypothetical protein
MNRKETARNRLDVGRRYAFSFDIMPSLHMAQKKNAIHPQSRLDA